MSIQITRRDFLKGTAAGAMGLAVSGLLGKNTPAYAEDAPVLSPQEAIARLNPQDYDYRSKDTDLSHVFSPWKLGNIELSHRMVKSAAGSDTGNNPDEFLAYYEDFANGGVEMIWVEDFVELYNNFQNPRKKPKETIPLKELADRLHAKGAHVGYQLSCMGQKFSGFDPATAAQYESAHAEHLTLDEIHMLQEDFIAGAKYIQEQGFDAVEINAAGNNIGQAFFSRMRNYRDDEYGPQSFENRARFVSEIIQGIKKECGDDFIVQVLINVIEENDVDMGDSTLSTTVEENCQICKMLEAAGADSLHLRLGPLGRHICQFASELYFTGYGIEGTTGYGTQFDFSRHWQGKLVANHSGCGLLLNIVQEVKQAVSIPCGGVTYMDPAHAPKFFDDAIAEGKLDFMMMTRSLCCEPQYVNKLREGRLDEIAPCTRCLHCHFDYDEDGKVYEHCRVNATTQRAYREAMPEGPIPLPADGEKKVMVVGGGPAGMEAARIAAERGYDVTLYEKKGFLGGLLPFASVIKGPHENLDDFLAYLKRQQEIKGVKVVTGQEVDADFIKAEAPDVVILAVGGLRDTLGLESTAGTKVVPIDSVMKADMVGQEVTIVGGSCQAVDMAQFLNAHGKHVTIVSPEGKDKLDKGQSSWVKTFTLPMLYTRGTRLWPNAQIVEVGDGTVTIHGETGVDMTIACDTVIEAMDMLPNKALAEGLDGIEVYCVGDCERPWNIAEAIASGNLTARKI